MFENNLMLLFCFDGESPANTHRSENGGFQQAVTSFWFGLALPPLVVIQGFARKFGKNFAWGWTLASFVTACLMAFVALKAIEELRALV